MGLFDLFKKSSKNQQASPRFDYSCKIFAEAMSIANTLQKQWKLEKTEWFAILIEYLYLILNLTDRVAFVTLPTDNRNKVMFDLAQLSIASAVDAICQEWSAPERENIKADLMHNYKVSRDGWGKFTVLFPEENEKMGDTVFWEFSKHVVSLAGFPENTDYIKDAYAGTLTAYKGLNTRAFLEHYK